MANSLRYGALYAKASSLTVAASGGIVLGGGFTTTVAYATNMSGGIVLGGGFTVDHKVLTERMAGGVVLGGSATVNHKVLTESMSGGVVLGGVAAVTSAFTKTMSGGVVLRGSFGDLSTIKVSFANTVTFTVGPKPDPVLRQTVIFTSAMGNAVPLQAPTHTVRFKGRFRAVGGDLANQRYRR